MIRSVNPFLECRGNYSATSNDMKLVHWPLVIIIISTFWCATLIDAAAQLTAVFIRCWTGVSSVLCQRRQKICLLSVRRETGRAFHVAGPQQWNPRRLMLVLVLGTDSWPAAAERSCRRPGSVSLMGGLYNEDWTWRGRSPPRPFLAVSNLTAHPSTASVPITVLLYNVMSVAVRF